MQPQKAKIVSTVAIKQAWLDEIKEHLPGIEFELERTTEKLQMWYNTRQQSMYGVFSHLRQIVDAPTGYRYRVYVMSDAERKAYGITDHYAAYDNVDRDGTLDFYMTATERNLAKAKANGFRSNFARIFVHECSHGREQEQGREYLAATNPDRTHDWEAEGRLAALIDEQNTIIELKTKVSLLEQIVAFTKRLNFLRGAATLYHPVQFSPRHISQPYGVKNARYRLTGHHIGTDYAIPVGTPLYAPFDGEVTVVGTHPVLGHYLHYAYTFQGESFEERWLHLHTKPALGRYRRGVKVAVSGNTGESTGPHLHRERWRKAVRIDLINAQNFRELTLDPEA